MIEQVMPMKPKAGAAHIRRFARSAAVAIALAFSFSGCPALVVPQLAYEGYKYEHKNSADSSKKSKSQREDANQSHRAASPPSTDDSVE
jgi:hypothetical protein